MMLGTGDLLAVIIALGSCLALIITSAIQNARLTQSRNRWRAECLEARAEMLDALDALDRERARR